MKRRAIVMLLALATASGATGLAIASEEGAGSTIVGDQDAAVGLYLAPWKNEEPADLALVPGLHDEAPLPLDDTDFARVHSRYSTLRAWRIERLQKNR